MLTEFVFSPLDRFSPRITLPSSISTPRSYDRASLPLYGRNENVLLPTHLQEEEPRRNRNRNPLPLRNHKRRQQQEVLKERRVLLVSHRHCRKLLDRGEGMEGRRDKLLKRGEKRLSTRSRNLGKRERGELNRLCSV